MLKTDRPYEVDPSFDGVVFCECQTQKQLDLVLMCFKKMTQRKILRCVVLEHLLFTNDNFDWLILAGDYETGLLSHPKWFSEIIYQVKKPIYFEGGGLWVHQSVFVGDKMFLQYTEGYAAGEIYYSGEMSLIDGKEYKQFPSWGRKYVEEILG